MNQHCEKCGEPAAVWVVVNPDDKNKRKVIANLCYGCAKIEGDNEQLAQDRNGQKEDEQAS